MAGLMPNMSTAGIPRPHMGSVGTSVSSTLKTRAPSLKSGGSSRGVSLHSVKIPKGSMKSQYPKLSKGSLKAPKSSSPKISSLQSKLKSIISSAKKNPPMPMSSAVGAPGGVPSPAFFGSPSAPPGGIGLGM